MVSTGADGVICKTKKNTHELGNYPGLYKYGMFEYSAILLALVVGLRTSNLMDHGLQPGENRASLTLGLQPVLILTFFTHNLGLLRCITGIRQPGPGQIFDGRAIGSCCSVLES